MQPTSTPAPATGGASARPAAAPHRGRSAAIARPADDRFVELLKAYRVSGGLARADEVVAQLDRDGHAGVAVLARRIVERRVICFEWQAQTWLPWFQFRRDDQGLEPAVAAVLAELAAVYDGWEIADWFARPNSALDGFAPVDALTCGAGAVLQAARADRFVATG